VPATAIRVPAATLIVAEIVMLFQGLAIAEEQPATCDQVSGQDGGGGRMAEIVAISWSQNRQVLWNARG
jgi:hypothetical protein